MIKTYQVFYELKYDGREETRHIFVAAKNRNEAKKLARAFVMAQTGKYAFHCRFIPTYRK